MASILFLILLDISFSLTQNHKIWDVTKSSDKKWVMCHWGEPVAIKIEFLENDVVWTHFLCQPIIYICHNKGPPGPSSSFDKLSQGCSGCWEANWINMVIILWQRWMLAYLFKCSLHLNAFQRIPSTKRQFLKVLPHINFATYKNW